MKKIILSLFAMLVLGLAGHLAAQKVLIPSGTDQEQLELRQMAAFQGQTEAIPYQPVSRLSAYTDLSQKMDVAVKMRPLSENLALQKALKAHKRKSAGKASTADLTVDTVLNTAYWGMLSSAEDGKQLLVTMEYRTLSPTSWYFSGITYTLFDENLKPGKSFSINTPSRTQEINIMGNYSTRFFNYDAKKEFLVSVHSFAEGQEGPASCRDTLFIINEDGDVLRKFGHTSGAMLHSVTKDGSPENRVQLIDAFYSDLADTMKTSIYKAMDVMQDNPEPLFTFYIDEDLTTYANGALAAFSEIEGEPCYVTTQYEKPFVADDNHSGDEIIVEKDNRFELYIYDVDFQLRKKITLPLIGLDENEFSFSTLMYFGKYMITRHVFNNDDKYEIIYAMDRYDISCDCNKLQFYLMDEDGSILKEIADEVASVTELQAIRGENDEFALCLGDEDAVTGISMLDIPSLEINFHFPALYKNELLSMNFERVPAEKGGYNYVFGLGRGESADGTVYGGIIYYDRQGNAVKRHRIDLGEDCLLFTPIINPLTMNPYAFIPDEKQEYLYFYRFSKNDAAGRGFGIANEEKTLYKWQDNGQDGNFSSAGILTNENATELRDLYITWEGTASTKHVFYRLPLKGIELQGEGTQASPYIITTPGELDLVRNYPEAWFILGNDIDMASFTGVNMQGFNSIPVFKGNFDGKGHFIENIIINGNGIFKNVEGGTIANLSMRNVAFSSTGRAEVGAIAGSLMMESKVTNCHVESDIVVSSDRVGGLVGQAVNASVIDRCSFTGHISGSSESVGGIAGDLRTSGTVQNSYVKGSVAGKENVGGIVGSMLNGAVVENSYSQASVYASAYMAGGIVGENDGAHVRRTYATGKVEVDTLFESKWFKGTAGGIAGFTVPNNFRGQIKYNFALNDTVSAPSDAYRVASIEYYVSTDTVKSLDSNFALASMKIGPKNALATANNDSCVMDRNHGQSGTLETFNQAFYEQHTWQFGDNASAPWQMTGGKPALWWEKLVRGVEMSVRWISVNKGGSVTLNASVIPQDAVDKTLLWSSDAPQVAIVDNQGVVKGINAGKAVITAKTPDGVYSASCQVTVIIPVEKIAFPQKEMVVPVGYTKPLSVTVLPEDATDKTVLYQSLNPAIALTGGPAVYGVEVGTTQIVAMSEQSGVSDTCTVYVEVPITGIVLNENSISLDKKTPTFQLKATVYPEEAANNHLLWKTEDSKVAYVTNTGLVYARDKGETIITVSSQDEKVSAVCFVTVTEFVSAANEGETRDMVVAYMQNDEIVAKASCGMEWIKVYNLSGACVAGRSGIGADKVTVDAAKLPQGLYLLQIGLAGGKTVNAKVMR